MNALKEIVHTMSDVDKKAFISYLKKKNKRKDTHNVSLFKFLQTDDISLIKNNSKGAHHALRKRLYDSLIEFLGNRKFEAGTTEEYKIMRLLMVAKMFFEHKLFKEAFKCLAKAETAAASTEHFSLLNEIYQMQVSYSHLGNDELALIIAKLEDNMLKMRHEEQMNITYALLRKELTAIYHHGKVLDFKACVLQTMEQQGVLPDALTFKSLYQILFIANEYASLYHNYRLIEPFVRQASVFIDGREALGEKSLYYHVYVLYLLANMHFRNFRFIESEAMLIKMEQQMQKQGKSYYNRFFMRYSLLAALNKNYMGNPGAAIHMAAKALEQYKEGSLPDVHDLQLSLLVFYLQQSDRTALKIMRIFGHTDLWYEKKMGMDWAIKKKMTEILLHTQFENEELALSMLKSFKKRYKKYLIEVNEERVLDYLGVVEQYITAPENISLPRFRIGFKKVMEFVNGDSKDVFIISFVGWLKARVEKKQVYETILKLLQP